MTPIDQKIAARIESSCNEKSVNNKEYDVQEE